jgi:hypothetical protein
MCSALALACDGSCVPVPEMLRVWMDSTCSARVDVRDVVLGAREEGDDIAAHRAGADEEKRLGRH